MSTTARTAGYRPATRSRDLFSMEYWGPGVAMLAAALWAAGLVIGFQNALAVLVLLGFGLALLGLRQPMIGLLGVGMLCTLDPLMRVYLETGGLLRWNTFNYWLLLVSLLGIPALLRRHDPHTRLYQAFLLLLLIGLTYSPSLLWGSLNILNASVYLGLLVYCARADRYDHAWYWLGLVTGTLTAVGGLVFFIKQSSLPYINPNALVAFPQMGLITICLSFAAGENRVQRTTLLRLLAAISFCWVFLTGSRGGLLVAIVCATYLLMQVPGFGRRLAMLASAILVGLIVMTQFADLSGKTMERLHLLVDTQRSASTRTSGRYDLLLGGWYIFLENPLGVGTGGYKDTWAGLGRRPGMSRFGFREQKAAHAAWVKVLAENGVPGVTLFAGYILSFAVVGWGKGDRRRLAIGLLVTTVLAAAFTARDFASIDLWMLAAGGTVLLHRPSGRPPS